MCRTLQRLPITRALKRIFSLLKMSFWWISIKCFHDNIEVSFRRCRRSDAFCRNLQQVLVRLMSIPRIARSTKTSNVHRFIYQALTKHKLSMKKTIFLRWFDLVCSGNPLVAKKRLPFICFVL